MGNKLHTLPGRRGDDVRPITRLKCIKPRLDHGNAVRFNCDFGLFDSLCALIVLHKGSFKAGDNFGIQSPSALESSRVHLRFKRAEQSDL